MLTTTTRLIHDQPVSIMADTDVQPQTNVVLDGLAAAAPELLSDGASFRVGWGRLRIVEHESQFHLTTLRHPASPSGSSAPTDDLTVDLRVLAGLETFCDIVGSHGSIPHFADSVWIEDGVAEARDIYIERRHEPSPGYAGCFIGVCDGRPRGRIRGARVEDLLSIRPSVIQCLGMPLGAYARLHSDRLTAVVTANGTDVWDGDPVERPSTHPMLHLIDRAQAVRVDTPSVA
jgi:hypothetical protein